MWALDTLEYGRCVETEHATELGTGTCLSAPEIQAKERSDWASHGAGVGGDGWGALSLVRLCPGVTVSIFLSSSSPVSMWDRVTVELRGKARGRIVPQDQQQSKS